MISFEYSVGISHGIYMNTFKNLKNFPAFNVATWISQNSFHSAMKNSCRDPTLPVLVLLVVALIISEMSCSESMRAPRISTPK